MSHASEQPQFSWLDAFILTVFAASGFLIAVLNDQVFFNLLPSLASHQAPWQSLPDWVADLELPAKRVQWDFLALLSVVSVGVGLVILRGRHPGVRNGLPGPGVAAGGTAALVVIEQTVERNTGAYWFEVEAAVTAAILGVWSYLLLARAWKARDDWRDCLGRWLAWCWLCQLPAHILILTTWG
jgi:hypothetical protein